MTTDREPAPRSRMEWIGTLVGLLGGAVAVIVALVQLGQGIAQDREELRWKRAETARRLVDEMVADDGWKAMEMMDWELRPREYEIAPGRKVKISADDVYRALAADDTTTNDTLVYISDRMDRVFYLVSHLEQAVRSGLVRREDVRYPLSWYAAKRMCPRRRIFEDYLREDAAPETLRFFQALPEWTACEPAAAAAADPRGASRADTTSAGPGR